MKLTHICIVTENLPGLRDFYQEILQVQPEQFKDDYAEFGTGGAILSLFELKSHEALAPKSMLAGANRSIELEFQVEDVDIEYARLNGLQEPIEWVMPPTTLPWGNRSIYFRDPDGNLINFYTRVDPQ
jgi:catechol 2,3-dioxygenase-like lactoylglutathione lyase family enzyme